VAGHVLVIVQDRHLDRGKASGAIIRYECHTWWRVSDRAVDSAQSQP
jgi:hypothetical protein